MITTLTASEVVPHPTAPQHLDETGSSLDLILQLVLKTLHFSGELSGTQLSQRIGLMFPVLSPALDLLKAQHQIQIVGGGIVGGAFAPRDQRARARSAGARDQRGALDVRIRSAGKWQDGDFTGHP